MAVALAILKYRIGFTINLRAHLHPNLRPDDAIFVKRTMNRAVMQESKMIKEAESTCWRSAEIIQMSVLVFISFSVIQCD